MSVLIGGLATGISIGKKLKGVFGKKADVFTSATCTNFMSENEKNEFAAFLKSSKDRFSVVQTATTKILNKQKRKGGQVQQAVSNANSIASVWFTNVNGSSDCKHGGATEKEMLRLWQSGLRQQVKSWVNVSRGTIKSIPVTEKIVSRKPPPISTQISSNSNFMLVAVGAFVLVMLLK